MRLCLRFIMLWIALSCAPALHAQGCATCGNNAAASPESQRRALNRGIVVLLVPTLGAIGAFAILLYKHRR